MSNNNYISHDVRRLGATQAATVVFATMAIGCDPAEVQPSTTDTDSDASPRLEPAVLVGADGREVEVTAEVRDGWRILEGDIIIGPSEETDEDDDEDAFRGAFMGRSADNYGALWPNGVVYYQRQPGYSSANMYTAMATWQAATGIVFVEYPHPSGHVLIGNFYAGCSAHVGRWVNNQTVVNIGPGCDTVSVWLHELGHTIGLWHEQSRTDRDAHIAIHWQNIIPGMEYAFHRYVDAGFLGFGFDMGPYDLNSIMHYDSWAFTSNGAPTITTLAGAGIAPKTALSAVDQIGVVASYQLASTARGFGRLDFNGDRGRDLAIFQKNTGLWYINGTGVVAWGEPSDAPVAADYNGDSISDIAVYRRSTGQWWIVGQPVVTLGADWAIPVPGDYDGDGRAEPAVWYPTDGTWHTQTSYVQWGINGDIPVPGDYNGDGRTDRAIWRPSDGTWWIHGIGVYTWGIAGDVPVQGDYNGDGVTDIAIYRPSDQTWWIPGFAPIQYGFPGVVPVPGDYNGDNITEIAVYNPPTSQWYIPGHPVHSFGHGATDLVIR